MTRTTAMAKTLDIREEQFVHAFLRLGNASEAALAAGYAESTARVKACLWVGLRERCPEHKLHVWEAVQAARARHCEAAGVEAERVLREEACIAFADPADMYAPDGSLLPLHEMPERIRRSIASVKYDKSGGVTVRFYEKGASLSRLHKHLGCCEAEKHDHLHGATPEGELIGRILRQIDGGTKRILDSGLIPDPTQELAGQASQPNESSGAPNAAVRVPQRIAEAGEAGSQRTSPTSLQAAKAAPAGIPLWEAEVSAEGTALVTVTKKAARAGSNAKVRQCRT